MKYWGPINSTGGINGTDGYADGDAVAGTQGSIPTFRGFEQLLRETSSLVSLSGLTPSSTIVDTQIAQAIQTGRQTFATVVGGTANAITATLSPAPVQYTDGMRLFIKPIAKNTGATTINVNGLGIRSIVRRDGSALAAEDIVTGNDFGIIYDAPNSNWQIFTLDLLIIDTPITKTVHGAGADFANLTEAFKWVTRRKITSTGFVTFQLAAGQFVYTSAATLSHPDGARIKIAGATLLATFPTAHTSFTATGSSSGTRGTDANTNLTLLRSIFATELQFTGAGANLTLQGGMNLERFFIKGDLTTAIDGVIISGGVHTWTTMAIHGFNGRGALIVGATSLQLFNGFATVYNSSYGMSIELGSQVGSGGGLTIAANCGDTGIIVSGQLGQDTGTVASKGNAASGILASYGGRVLILAAKTAQFNGGPGFSSSRGGVMTLVGTGANAASSSSNQYGFYAEFASFIDCQNSTGSGNAIWGYQANSGSTIINVGGSTLGASGGSNPTVNVIGNSNSIIVN